jgi:hypothetical protein
MIAFDGPDLLARTDRVYLVPSGGMSLAMLARGVAGELPRDRRGYLTAEAEAEWVYGQASGQRPAPGGVRGMQIASADSLGRGTEALDLDALPADAADLYLIARFD